MTSEPPWNRIWTVTDYHDGPRGGIADLLGVPHVYACEFDETLDEYSDRFRLSPIDADVLGLAMEDWAIWCRFADAVYAGFVSNDQRPPLPRDRARHEELRLLIGTRLEIGPGQPITMRGEFRPSIARARHPDDAVRWFPIFAGE